MRHSKSFATITRYVLMAVVALCALTVATCTASLAAEPPKAEVAKSEPMHMGMQMAGGDEERTHEKSRRETNNRRIGPRIAQDASKENHSPRAP